MSVSNEIIAVLDSLSEKFGLAVDWTAQNILPQIQSLATKVVAWHFWTSVAWMIGAVIVFIMCQIKIGSLKKTPNFTWGDFIDGGAPAVAIILTAISIICLLVACTQVADVITCVVLPEKVLFEFVQSLLPRGGGS